MLQEKKDFYGIYSLYINSLDPHSAWLQLIEFFQPILTDEKTEAQRA